MSRSKKKRGKRAAKAVYESTGLAYVRQLQEAPLVFKGERVATTGMLARAFNVSHRRVQNSLNKALKQTREDGTPKLREGEHFVRLSGGETKALRAAIQAGSGMLASSGSEHNSFEIGPKVTRLTLLTKRGVLKVATKFFDSDDADDVHEELIETYLTVKEDLQGKLLEAAQVIADQITAPLLRRLDLLEDLHREDRAARKAAASRAAKDLAARAAEKKREAQTSNALRELIGEVKPGHSLEDNREQVYLFPVVSRTELLEFLAAKGLVQELACAAGGAA